MADTPQRIQLSRAKGWRMPPNTVKVDRSTRWGNPFKAHGDGYAMEAQLAVTLFRRLITEQAGLPSVHGNQVHATLGDIRRMLRGKNLACWCKPGTPCHADVLLELANAPEGSHG